MDTVNKQKIEELTQAAVVGENMYRRFINPEALLEAPALASDIRTAIISYYIGKIGINPEDKK